MMVNNTLFIKRRARLLEIVKEAHPGKDGAIVLFAGFEFERYKFRQESSFYYLTGLNEPAVVLVMHTDGKQVLYVPNFGKERHKWVKVAISNDSNASEFGLSEIVFLNEGMRGYSYSPFFQESNYTFLVRDLQQLIAEGKAIFAIQDASNGGYFSQHHAWHSLQHIIPDLQQKIINIACDVYEMRRVKDEHELQMLNNAINITCKAQHEAASCIKPGVYEYEVQAKIEETFLQNNAKYSSFPSIVATGKNTTVLHYTENDQAVQEGDLVVVDIGAEFGGYAGDITRTYPASGFYTPRQKEIYQLVLDAQEYIAQVARPGMFLRNSEKKELSLQYLTIQFFEKHGLAQYFPHSIGHYLGLDVHDVGTYQTGLQVGDVFTIEPGLYIPEEALGVRIEDNYLMHADGAECLSKGLVKKIDEIERLMSRN